MAEHDSSRALPTRPTEPSRSFSLALYQRGTLAEAIQTPSLLCLARERGLEVVAAGVVAALTEADALLGGGMSAEQIALLARSFMQDFGGRPVGTIVQAIRSGTRMATVGHKLTYPILCSWIAAIDAEVEEANFTAHNSTK